MSEVPPQDAAGAAAPADPLLGRRMGDCTLTRRIASGGMGVVYEAVQEPPGRKVAVKLMLAGLADDDGRVRFEHEARLLGNLRHPGIAQVFGAGVYVDASGERLPYFVMEFVPDAKTLTEYADAHALDVRDRVRLFVKICDAVQLGHAKGVIHRDLKPGNLLVDPDGNPKVIDFGIARTTVDEGDSTGPKTETGRLVGTLPYMSPEQVLGRRAEIDTRTDVYGLGVVLYELLTGSLPYDLEGLGLVQVASAICSRPPRPAGRLRPETAGDLTVILEKALAKEPDRRYATAAAFAQDLERFLSYAPITARPPSLPYQLRLFTRRHRGIVAGAVLGVLSLVAAAAVSLRFASQESKARAASDAQRERAVALLAKTRELVPWLLGEFDLELSRLPQTTRTRARLAEHVRDYLTSLTLSERDDRGVLVSAAISQVALASVLGGSDRSNLGRLSEALAAYGRAVELLDQALAQAPGDASLAARRARVRVEQAATMRMLSDAAGARRIVEEAVAWAEARLAEAPDDASTRRVLISAWAERANVLWDGGEREASVPDYRRVLAAWESNVASPADAEERARALLTSRLDLGTALLELGHEDEAGPLLQRVGVDARELRRQRQDGEALRTVRYVHSAVGRALLARGRTDAARASFVDALDCALAVAALDANDAEARLRLHACYAELARLEETLGDLEPARDHNAQAIALAEELVRREPADYFLRWDLRLARHHDADVLRRLGRLDEAEVQLKEALALMQARRKVLPAEVDTILAERDEAQALGNLALTRYRAVPSLVWAMRRLAVASGWAADLVSEAYLDERGMRATYVWLRVAQGWFQQAVGLLRELETSGRLKPAIVPDLRRLERGLLDIEAVLATEPK